VQIQVARAVPVVEVAEYVATLKSRDSAVIMPEVEGQVTGIFVRSGDRVTAGAPLVQIDPARQQATVRSQQETRAAKQAGLEFMTSFTFILGVLPLALPHGAGQAGRHSVGTTVFGGMIASTLLNLYFIPVLYVLIEQARERAGARIGR
jgi:multidrug efflux pump subunit AcrA (membrane-fusion protein)